MVHVRLARPALGFLILFALYQSAEGVGQRVLDSFAVQAGAGPTISAIAHLAMAVVLMLCPRRWWTGAK